MTKIWIKDGKFIELTEDQMKDFDAAQLGAYAADKNKSQTDKLILDFEAKMDEKTKGFLTSDEVDKIKSDFSETIKELPIEALNKYVDTIDKLKTEVKDVTTLANEIKEIARIQGVALKASEGNKIPAVRRKTTREDHLKTLVHNAFASKEFEEFEGRGFKGSSSKMFLDQSENKIALKEMVNKATVATSSHTGVVMVSEISDIVTDDAPTRRSHVRDIINVGMTDQAQIVAGQVYDFTDALTLGAVMLAENGEAPESVFKSKENTWTMKRIANSMRISKREIKVNGLQWVIDKVLSKLPDATLFVEDVQLLFGDGLSNNVKGLANNAQAFNLVPNTYAAADFLSVATYNSGAQSLITFNAAHGMKNGDNLTIALATEASYNATHTSVEVINTTQVIIDLAYVAESLINVAKWTGTSTSPFYLEIEDAQEYDVLAVADANLEAGEYMNSGYVIHPSQSTQMGLLKATDSNYLNITKDASGKIASVNGKPVVTTTAMPYGKFICGDFSRNGLELKEFTPLNIQFAEDVESIKKNEIVVVIEEEIIFPIYNPYWFTYGKFSTAKAQLLKPDAI